MIKKYCKKLIVIEAVQWKGDNYEEIYNFTRGNCYFPTNSGNLIIKTVEGNMIAKKESYIIKTRSGNFYPCRKEIFEEIYEEVSDKR